MADLTLEVPDYQAEQLARTVRRLYDHTGALTEQLRYVLMHLDEENIPALPGLQQELQDAMGNISTLSQSAAALLVRIENAEGDVSTLTQTAQVLSSRVESAEGNFSTLTQTANSLSSKVSTVEGNLSTLTQTANSLSSRVSSAEGSLSTLTQTANILSSKVNSAEGNISTLTQTANTLSSKVSTAEGNLSTLTQTANTLSSKITTQSGQISTLQQTATGLSSTVSDLSGKYSSLKQTVDGFDFTGLVTFSDLDDELGSYATKSGLRNGTTTINGECITTGMIDCDYIELYGQMRVNQEYDGDKGGYIGYCAGYSKTGIGVMHSEDTGQCICTNGGARLSYGGDTHFSCTEKNIAASEAISEGSDRRIKNSFAYDLPERYGKFFRSLKPCRFKRNDSKSNRYHTGFVAQEIEEAVLESGLQSDDLAAYCIDETGAYTVRYTELIALNTAFIQQLLARIEALERNQGGQE